MAVPGLLLSEGTAHGDAQQSAVGPATGGRVLRPAVPLRVPAEWVVGRRRGPDPGHLLPGAVVPEPTARPGAGQTLAVPHLAERIPGARPQGEEAALCVAGRGGGRARAAPRAT